MSTINKILVFSDYFYPSLSAGGPVTTLLNQISYLSNYYDFFIVTRSTDLGEKKNLPNITPNLWQYNKSYNIIYISNLYTYFRIIFNSLLRINFQIVYLNSFFSFKYSVIILLLIRMFSLNIKVVLNPRGEMHSNALNYKKQKKKLFLKVSKILKLHKNLVWHSSSHKETEQIKAVFPSAIKIIEIPHLFERNLKTTIPISKRQNQIKIIFLSRIHPTKNLHFALEVLSELSGDIEFDIYGPIEVSEYWKKCKIIIDKLNFKANLRIKYQGILERENLAKTIRNYHVMFFPTQNENFGNVIAESLSNGIPVITSDRTPWEDLENYKAGYSLSLEDKDKFVTALSNFLSFTQAEYNLWCQGTHNYLDEKFDFEKLIELYKTKLFN